MKAMVLAAGLGSRLGKITTQTPKCLVQAGGRSLLEHVVENLKRAGVDEIVINLFHLGEQIEEYVRSRNSFGISVKFTRESELLGTGGGVQFARELLADEPFFFVHNSDIYSDLDLTLLRDAHVQSSSIATLAMMHRESDRALLFDTEGLIGWKSPNGSSVVRESADPEALSFSGIQIVSSEIFEYLHSDTTSFSIITGYLNAVRAGKVVRPFLMDKNFWIDAGTPERLEALRLKMSA